MPVLTNKLYLTILLVPLLALPAAAADEPAGQMVQPFYSRNQNPFVQIFGLPALEIGSITPPKELTGRFVCSAANNFSLSAHANERIVLDGETYKVTGVFRYGLGNGLELGLDLPYISHSGGQLDSFIENFHEFFSLSDGSRPNRSPKLIEYRYEESGVTRYLLSHSASGLGDILLSGSHQLYNNPDNRSAAALRATLKLPTGKVRYLHGSGAADLALAITAHHDLGPSTSNLTFFGGTGILLTGKGKVIADRQRPVVGFASLGTGVKALDWLDLKIQFDGHTPFFESNLIELGKGSVQANMGGSIYLSTRSTLVINVVEDIMVHTAPDVVFYIELLSSF